MDTLFRDIVFDEGTIRIGPSFDPARYYVIGRKDLKPPA